MALSTRISEDPCRINQQMAQMTYNARWVFDTPGNGSNPDFILNQSIIPQKWGGNLYTNSIDVNSHLLGINKRVGKDCHGYVPPNLMKNSHPIKTPTTDKFKFEIPRASEPVWEIREDESNYLWQQPLVYRGEPKIFIPFQTNTNTRLESRNNYQKKQNN